MRAGLGLGEELPCPRIAGGQLDGPGQLLDRLVKLARTKKEGAQAVVGLGKIRRDLDRPAELLDGRRGLASLLERIAEVELRHEKLGIQRDGGPVLNDALVRAPHHHERRAEVGMGRRFRPSVLER